MLTYPTGVSHINVVLRVQVRPQLLWESSMVSQTIDQLVQGSQAWAPALR